MVTTSALHRHRVTHMHTQLHTHSHSLTLLSLSHTHSLTHTNTHAHTHTHTFVPCYLSLTYTHTHTVTHTFTHTHAHLASHTHTLTLLSPSHTAAAGQDHMLGQRTNSHSMQRPSHVSLSEQGLMVTIANQDSPTLLWPRLSSYTSALSTIGTTAVRVCEWVESHTSHTHHHSIS